MRTTYGTTFAELSNATATAEVELSDGREGTTTSSSASTASAPPRASGCSARRLDSVYSGFVVWRVTTPRPDHITCGALYQAVGVKAGYIPLSQELMYLLLVHPEPHHARFDRSQHVDMLRERLAPFEGMIGDIRDGLKDTDDVVYWPLREVMLPLPWFKGRVVLCGDAAHACVPHLTQGAAMALEDAVVLPDELAATDRRGRSLQPFSERRYPRAKFVQDVSRGILDAEMPITAENIQHAFAHMREGLPGQMAGVDAFLNQPA